MSRIRKPVRFDPTKANWDTPGHVEYRQACVDVYREYFGVDKLASDVQYWALCGRQKIGTLTEFPHLLSDGFLTANQFYGVDRETAIIEEARAQFPDAHWFNGELIDVIRQHFSDFNPGYIHLDSMNMVEAATKLLSDVMYCIEQSQVKKCMVTINLIFRFWYHDYSGSTNDVLASIISATGNPDCWSYNTKPVSFVSTRAEMMARHLFYVDQ